MELVRGRTLSALEAANSATNKPSVIYEVLEALEYANSQGIIHRDVKPSNIMVIEDGNIPG